MSTDLYVEYGDDARLLRVGVGRRGRLRRAAAAGQAVRHALPEPSQPLAERLGRVQHCGCVAGDAFAYINKSNV